MAKGIGVLTSGAILAIVEHMNAGTVFSRAALFLFLVTGMIGCAKKEKAVGPDTVPPEVRTVFSFDTTRVLVEFTEAVDSASASDTLNYEIESYEMLAVHHVDVDPMGKRCVLMTAHQESTSYHIAFKNIEDISGNSLKDTVVSFLGIGMAVDSIIPTLTIYDPSSGDTMYGFEYFSVNASDNFAVKTVRFFLNDSLAGEDGDFPFYAIIDVRSLPEGSTASLYAAAEDFGANIGYSETLDVFIGHHPDFPYVVIDTLETAIYPEHIDVTEDGSKVFYARLPSYPYTTTSCLMVIYTDTNTDEVMVSLDPPLPIYYLDVYGDDFVYFTHGTSFSIFDIGLQQVVSTTDIGGAAQGIARGAGEKLYIARRSTQEIMVYSLQSNSFIDSTSVAGEPTALMVDPVHGELYVALIDTGMVAIIDTQTDSLIDTIFLSGEAFEVQFSPDYSRAYISEIFDHSIAVVQTATHAVIDEISPSGLNRPKGMAISNDGMYLFVTSLTNRLYVYSTLDYSTVWDFDIGHMPYGVVLTPLNDKLYVTCSSSAEVYCIGY